MTPDAPTLAKLRADRRAEIEARLAANEGRRHRRDDDDLTLLDALDASEARAAEKGAEIARLTKAKGVVEDSDRYWQNEAEKARENGADCAAYLAAAEDALEAMRKERDEAREDRADAKLLLDANFECDACAIVHGSFARADKAEARATAAESDLAALRATVERLCVAIEPFAHISASYDNAWDDDESIGDEGICVGTVRRVAAERARALAEAKEGRADG